MTSLIRHLSRYKKHVPLWIGLLIAAPVAFFQAFRFTFPLGYAGMFTQMAEQIAQANFALPMTIPHYGPGGINFVYPPLSLYIFALAIKLGISTWAYLRFIPAIFTLFSLIPLYYLTCELLGSEVAGLVAVVLSITAPPIYYTHVWSAGVVRGLAFAFCLAGLFFYLRTLRNFSWRNFALAGVFLGLLLTTHWLYVAFAALFGLACFVSEWKLARLPIIFGLVGAALLVASPWLGLILARHGFSSLWAASSSHRNADFLAFLQDGKAALQFLGGNLEYVTNNWFLMALALPGFILLLLQRKFHLPLAFFLVLFMGEASFYAMTLAAMLAGAFCAEIFQQVSKISGQTRPVLVRFLVIDLVVLTSLAILFAAGSGLAQIAQYEPEIDAYSLQMAKFVRSETSPAATYLYIGKINEAEWFPYLLDRTPVLGMWGSEWKGTYAQQLDALVSLRTCQAEKDWICMENLQRQNNVAPDLLIGPNQRWLAIQIRDTHAWQVLYTNERYLVWGKLK